LRQYLDAGRGWDNLFHMNNLSMTARNLFNATIALVSGLLVAAAIAFGAVALAITGLIIGLAGAIVARTRPAQRRPAVITLNARRTGRGWSVDPSDR
jgi:hypothetical protein